MMKKFNIKSVTEPLTGEKVKSFVERVGHSTLDGQNTKKFVENFDIENHLREKIQIDAYDLSETEQALGSNFRSLLETTGIGLIDGHDAEGKEVLFVNKIEMEEAMKGELPEQVKASGLFSK